MVHPLLMVQVPVNGQHDALLKGSFGVPAQIVLDLGGVDAVAAVVTQTVGDVLDELLADALVLQTVVQLVDDGLDDEDVGALVVAAHVVHLADLAAIGHHVDGRIDAFGWPSHPWLKMHTHVPTDESYEIPTEFDPNLALAIIWGENLEQAKERGMQFLDELTLQGENQSGELKSNVNFLRANTGRILRF